MRPNSTTQSDMNMNFDGMERMAPQRSTKYQTNTWSGHMNDGRLVNKGRGPTRGNQDYRGEGGPSVTRDSFRPAPTDAVPSTKINPDRINLGRQERTPGGVRAWDPKATQNYNGNPDKIRMGQSGGGTYNSERPGKTPTTRRGDNNFNFGPKSQY